MDSSHCRPIWRRLSLSPGVSFNQSWTLVSLIWRQPCRAGQLRDFSGSEGGAQWLAHQSQE